VYQHRKLVTLITLALFVGTGTAMADKKDKGHGAGGVADKHMSEQGAEHRQYNAGGVSDEHRQDGSKEKVKSKHKELKDHKEKKTKEMKDRDDHDRDDHNRDGRDHDDRDNHDDQKTNRRWWQLFGDE
jgi:hypothetical protein